MLHLLDTAAVPLWTLAAPTPGIAATPRVVYVAHGTSYPYSDIRQVGWADPRYAGAWGPLLDAGFHVAVHAMGGDLWGNDTALATLLGFHQLLRDELLGPHEVYLYGVSMGGLAVARAAAGRGGFPTPKAVACVDGYFALGQFNTGSEPLAWPGGYTDSPTAIDPAGFGSVPFLLSASYGDTNVKRALHTDVLAARLGPQATVLTTTGAHVIPAHFTGDAAAFFDAAPEPEPPVYPAADLYPPVYPA